MSPSLQRLTRACRNPPFSHREPAHGENVQPRPRIDPRHRDPERVRLSGRTACAGAALGRARAKSTTESLPASASPSSKRNAGCDCSDEIGYIDRRNRHSSYPPVDGATDAASAAGRPLICGVWRAKATLIVESQPKITYGADFLAKRREIGNSTAADAAECDAMRLAVNGTFPVGSAPLAHHAQRSPQNPPARLRAPQSSVTPDPREWLLPAFRPPAHLLTERLALPGQVASLPPRQMTSSLRAHLEHPNGLPRNARLVG
jgi:hypothetical protein